MLQPNDLVFTRFLVIARLDFGAFSAVYRVLDQMSNREVALKVELPDEQRECTMINHEFEIARAVSSQFLCQSMGEWRDGALRGLSMELLGENLAAVRRKRCNPPSVPLLLNIAIHALKGLMALHDVGIIHSDVKPSNLAVRVTDSSYTIVLFDFGLAQYEGENQDVTTFRNTLQRNPRYMSLATHETGVWSKRDDFTALLYTLSDFWRDELPWDGRTTARLVFPVKKETSFSDLLPEELHIMIDLLDNPCELINHLENTLSECERDAGYELHYILDPPDPEVKPKMVKYFFEDSPDNKVFMNKHSA
jgi:tau tubulin kinase